jgi:orotidine-5'-phosphate decarboxylase
MPVSQEQHNRVIVALDYPSSKEALQLVDKLEPQLCKLKVGKELFTAAGPSLVEELVRREFDVFLDLKFHDIPNTVAQAVSVAADLGVWMTDVHASGGRRMMEASAEALVQRNSQMLLIAVTVLTSMEQSDLQELGINCPPQEQVARLAKLAMDCGMHGLVSSAMEAAQLRNTLGSGCVLVTPGIRPACAQSDDQRRIVTPAEAIANGSSYLVVGRPITRAPDPLAALLAINDEIQLD